MEFTFPPVECTPDVTIIKEKSKRGFPLRYWDRLSERVINLDFLHQDTICNNVSCKRIGTAISRSNDIYDGTCARLCAAFGCMVIKPQSAAIKKVMTTRETRGMLEPRRLCY